MGWAEYCALMLMATPRKIYSWLCRDRVLMLGERTIVMGILNVTPDSFSDGGSFSNPSAAVEHALEMAAQGADIIDVGGESTRPGAEPVPVSEEIARVVPVIEQIRAQSDVFISIDSMKAEVALQALNAGADIINDVSALEADPVMAEVAEKMRAGIVLMHMKGSPKTMQESPSYGDVVKDISSYLRARLDYADQNGIHRDRIVIDPGIGFGKTPEHNLALLRRLPVMSECDRPVLIGASRKSFIGHVTGRDDPVQRKSGSLGVAAWAIFQGAHILRVHDVIDTCDICRVMDKLTYGKD